MNYNYIVDPLAIEKKSMELIEPYLSEFDLDEKSKKIYSRIIHASGDVEYAKLIRLHPKAIESGLAALREGAQIYSDVKMVQTGINSRRLADFKSEVICRVSDEQIINIAKEQGITRSMAAMRAFGKKLNKKIVAVGNAPTALFEIIRMMEEENIQPSLIVGVPVGFVGAKESKDLLCAKSSAPYITVLGNKGGSPIAAAIINALLYLEEN